jgi:uncharacterized protein (DUF4415 family)
MEFTWSQVKRNLNLKSHGLDFLDAPSLFEGVTFTFEDDRFSYGEQRFVTLGLLAGIPVSILCTRRTNMKSASSLSAKQPAAKRRSTAMESQTDWARLESKKATAKASEDHPEADARHIVRGIVRRGLQPLPAKALISLRLDQDVLEWFKAQGPGYQTRINTVLRAFRDASV